MSNPDVARFCVMNIMRVLAAFVCLLWLGALVSRADTHYVAHADQNPITNYLDWTTAASNIQDAIDVTGSGDTVLVSNGVYDTGATVAPGDTVSNRVCITNAITLRSVNGAAVTIIKGTMSGVTTACSQIRPA